MDMLFEETKTLTVRFTDDALGIKSAVHVSYYSGWFLKWRFNWNAYHMLHMISNLWYVTWKSFLGEWKPFKDISELKDKIIEKLIKANEDSNLGE